MLLAGTRDPSCELHALAQSVDVLRLIFAHLRRLCLPPALITQIRGKPISGKLVEPHWLAQLRMHTDWTACTRWVMEKSDDGTTSWTRHQQAAVAEVGALSSAMAGCSLGGGGGGGVSLAMAIAGATVTFTSKAGLPMTGVIIKQAELTDPPPRVRVRLAKSDVTAWLEVSQLESAPPPAIATPPVPFA